MNLQRIKYSGRKVYFDRPANTSWEPGDVKLVPETVAKRLLKFLEFNPFVAETTVVDEASAVENTQRTAQLTEEEQAALAMQQVTEQDQQVQKQLLESMLLTVESMDKPALEEYARKYEVELDKRLGVVKLRAEVATLIEQFGVR